MRISQRQMFTQYIGQMNNSLSALMESNTQGGTGKRINRPSDDPAGMARVMMYRESLSNIERNKANIGEATGWLNLADHALMQVSDVISKIKVLDLQAATGTMADENRDQNAIQLRGYLGELLNIANEKYNGQHIFAGHKVEEPAYQMGADVTCHYTVPDPLNPGKEVNMRDLVDFVAADGAANSTLIQFTESDTLNNEPRFIYSQDGGKTWVESDASSWTGSPNPADPDYPLTLHAGGSTIKIYPKDGTTYPPVTAVTPDVTDGPVHYTSKETLGGTWLTVRPSAVYMGDDHDAQTTQQYGPPVADLKAEGYFTRDISVRVAPPVNPGDDIQYSYSLDNGSTWVKATAPANSKQLAIPGGYITTTSATGFTQAQAQEFLVHPRRADINFEISSTQTVTVNNVGKDIFGGVYQEPFTEHPVTVGGPNLFDTVGKLIGYCETNDQDGIQRCLEELDDCLKLVTTKLADVGGRENRLQVAYETAVIRELSEESARSVIEDADVVTLMTKLAQQQLAYNTVLKSSSMIMQMSLMNFI